MKLRYWILLPALILVAGPPGMTGDGEDTEPPEDGQEIAIVTGGQDSDTDGTLNRVAEYEVVEANPLLGITWRTSPYEETTFGFEHRRVGSDEFQTGLELDLQRRLRVEGTLDGFLHRLVHDPIDNLQAVSEIKVVRRSDLEPNADYAVRARLLDIGAEFLPPATPGLSFRAGYHQVERRGSRQLLNTSHCTSCHTVSQGREVDETMQDFSLGVHLVSGRADIDYQVSGSEYTDRADTPLAPYDEAFRPATPGSAPDPTVLVKPFDDRLWIQNGQFPVAVLPDVKRLGHRLKARTALGTSSAINFTAMQSKTENRRTNLEYDFFALRGRYSTRLGQDWRLAAWAAHEELDNDDILVDLLGLNGLSTAPVANPPGYSGVTYQDWRRGVDGDPDLTFESFLRMSAMDRTDDRVGVDAVWRAVRRGSLRLGYKFRRIDRENVVLADGDGVSTSHTLKVGWNQRWRNRVRWNNGFWYTDTDNPYVAVDGGMRLFSGDVDGGIVDGEAPSPKSPASLQYYQLHDLRAANLSGLPSQEFGLRSNASWGPRNARWSLGANVRYRDAENDELNYTDWVRDDVGVGVNFWVAAAPRLSVMIGLDGFRQTTDAEAIVPVMDG